MATKLPILKNFKNLAFKESTLLDSNSAKHELPSRTKD